MNIFGFRPFKGKFNLGNADDIPTNKDGTLIGSIKQINNDLSVFSFRDNEGQAQYSMDKGATWVDFKHPAGTLSITANGTYNVADYASAQVNVSSITPSSAKVVKQEQAGTATFTGCKVGKTYAVTRFWYGGPSTTSSSITGATVLYSQLFRYFAVTGISYVNAMVWVVKATSTTISANRLEAASAYDDGGRNPSYTSLVQLD